MLSPGRVIGVGAGDPNDLAGGSFAAGDIKADDFQRVASAGSFGLSGFSARMYTSFLTEESKTN